MTSLTCFHQISSQITIMRHKPSKTTHHNSQNPIPTKIYVRSLKHIQFIFHVYAINHISHIPWVLFPSLCHQPHFICIKSLIQILKNKNNKKINSDMLVDWNKHIQLFTNIKNTRKIYYSQLLIYPTIHFALILWHKWLWTKCKNSWPKTMIITVN